MSVETDLPASWLKCSLGDVIDYGRTDKAEPEEIPADAWILELEDVEKDTSRVLQRKTYAERRSKSTKNRFRPGDVLYGKLRPYLNKVVRATEGGFCTTEIVPLTPTAALDGDYLFYWLKHPRFLEYVTSVSHGLNMPRLGTGAGQAAPFVLAPLPEQKRIADKLDALLARVDACRGRLDRVPGILKRFRQAVLAAATSGELTREWRASMGTAPGTAAEEVQRLLAERRARHSGTASFKGPVAPDLTHWSRQVPDSWSVESVSAYAQCLDHLRVPVTKKKRATSERLYPYYGANGLVDMVDGYLFDDELVLVTEDETFYGRVKPIAYRTSGRCWVNNHAHVLLAGSRARADYLAYSLMHYDVRPWLTGTTGRAKLTQGALNALPLAIPPEAELKIIVRTIETLFGLAGRVGAQAIAARRSVQHLTPLLLAQAFAGKLVPQDPTDAPASDALQQHTLGNNRSTGLAPTKHRQRNRRTG